jgi:hypothetical protein
MSTIWRSKRAITPVLSNVLLLVIAVAGMSIAITATYVITDNLHQAMGERFIIEDVWFTTGKVAIFLRNTGQVSIDFGGVYIDYVKQSFAPLRLEPLNYGWINLTYTWRANTVHYVKILTSRGTQVADYYKP